MLSPYEMRQCKDHCEVKIVTSILRLLVVFLPIGAIFLGMQLLFGGGVYTAWLLVIQLSSLIGAFYIFLVLPFLLQKFWLS